MKKIITLIFTVATVQLIAQKIPFNFEAKGMVVLSDADMVSSAYLDGNLKTENGVLDALTVVKWDSLAQNLRVRSLNVPNSVTNWVDGMDVSMDSKVAFVIDTRGSLPRSIDKIKSVRGELPKGNMLYAIDISDLENPFLLDRIKVGEEPLSVDVNPVTGELLIINNDEGNDINLIQWNGNKFGALQSFAFDSGNYNVTHANWHPSGKYFGATLEPKANKVAFFERSEGGISQIGKSIKVGSNPGPARFSKNGDYYVIPDLKWNNGYDAFGALVAVKFSKTGNHAVSSTFDVGQGPEGFAFSPNGKLIAVSNMGTNPMPMDHPMFGDKASITLLEFDEDNGQFKFLDNKEWEGILPEGITFDAKGDMIAVTSYDYLDLTERKGGVSFWEITDQDGKPQLKNTGFKISVTRGSHYIKIIK